ncbi:MAG: DNA repair exonuclease [Lachnospiraceae bacterium]
MRFIHIADVHLGANPEAGKAYTEHRGVEIWDSFAHVIDVCEAEQIELLLIAGDMFHRQPLLRELKEVNYLFSGLTKTKVVFVAGNHDYVKSNSYYQTFEWNSNVYPLLNQEMEYIEFPELEVGICGFSYHTKEILENRYDMEQAPGRQPYEILIAHGGDEKHIPFKRNKLISLDYKYIAFGHIHKAGIIEKNKIAYSGALEPIDKNDVGKHGYILGELSKDKTTLSFIPCAKREYVHLELPIQDDMTNGRVKDIVKEQVEKYGKENLYKVTLKGYRDPDILLDIEHMDAYGNILEVLDETNPAYHFEKLKEQNKENLLGKFIQRLEGHELDSIEQQALCEGVHALLETRQG